MSQFDYILPKIQSQISKVEADRPANAGRLRLNLDRMTRQFGERAAVELATELALIYTAQGIDVEIHRGPRGTRRCWRLA